MADDYKVGRNRPPRDNQFKPGQSGNPKGRPKGQKNLCQEVLGELLEEVTVTENGKPVTVSRARALIKAMLAKGAKGDVRAAAFLLEAGLKAEAATPPERPEGDVNDAAILARYAERLRKEKDHE